MRLTEDTLFLNTDIDKPDLKNTAKKYQALIDYYGIPASKTKLKELYNRLVDERDSNKEVLESILRKNIDEHIDTINYTGRSLDRNHIARYTKIYLDLDENAYITVNKSGNESISFKKSDIKDLIEVYKEEEQQLFLKSLLGYRDCLQFLSNLDQYSNCLIEYNKKLSDLNFINPNPEDDDIFYMYPKVNVAATGRYTKSKPAIQGSRADMKEVITAPKGYKIATMDIKGQEAHILIWGILNNDAIKSFHIQYKDAYKAFLKVLGYELTEENRNDVKVPILGVMNGMQLNSMMSLVKDKSIAKNILKTIDMDKGYIETVMSYTESVARSKNPMRKGLFGTELPVNRYEGNVKNQLKNGFFQLTAAEIVSLCIESFMYEVSNTKGLGPDNIRLLFTVYDEFVIIYKEELEDIAIALFEKHFKPVVDKWARFQGNPSVGKSYISK